MIKVLKKILKETKLIQRVKEFMKSETRQKIHKKLKGTSTKEKEILDFTK